MEPTAATVAADDPAVIHNGGDEAEEVEEAARCRHLSVQLERTKSGGTTDSSGLAGHGSCSYPPGSAGTADCRRGHHLVCEALLRS